MPFTFGECQSCGKLITMGDAIIDGYLKDPKTGKVKHKICYEDNPIPPKAKRVKAKVDKSKGGVEKK